MSRIGVDPQAHKLGMGMGEHFRILEAMETRQEELIELLKRRREADAKARVLLEKSILSLARVEEELAHLYQRKTYEITNDPEWEAASIDPREGVKTANWSEIVIEHLISTDEEWGEAKKTYYLAQEVHNEAKAKAIEIQSEIAVINEELGMLKNRSIYRAAMLFASRPAVIQLEGGIQDVATDKLPEGIPPRTPGGKGT